MNVVAENLYEYNTLDENGKVISPAENKVKFILSKDGKVTAENEYNTIMTADAANNYALDKVFTDWEPAKLSAQKTASAAQVTNGKLTWTGDAQMYVVEKNGSFVALTTDKSIAVDDASAQYGVRAANEMGGFGETSSVSTGIKAAASAGSQVVKTAIYAVDGTQLSQAQKGINIIVKTLADGSKKTEKMIVR